MKEAAKSPEQIRKRGLWGTTLFFVIYYFVALGLLRQWHSPHPWSRLDAFSGGYLLIGLIWGAAATRFHRAIFRSKEVLEEASGKKYDAKMLWMITALSLGELAVFLDYARWRLVPALVQPALQWLGLALALAGALWLLWVDTYLSRHFAGDLAARQIMSDGPYRFVRHPRYVALLVSRVSFSLALASILGWLFALGWLIAILRRIRLEEAHLRGIFGADYDAYASRTARLIPGLF